MQIRFEKLTKNDVSTVFAWLAEPHVQEFWDNTQGHKVDILNFAAGRKTPSSYASGKYVYWIAKAGLEPFAMLMTIKEGPDEDIGELKLANLSKTGNTYCMDYMIGNPAYLGKGYGAQTLADFVDYFRKSIDPEADTFMIDPTLDNPRAKRVYMKAGFEYVDDFLMQGDCSGTGEMHHLLIKRY
ncbi:MAG: GNAT family N-acetyltransferase [Proteobacteria bacterium]|nr:GNAT family N-acetyltransferase [Pseudomonadota bacterium]